MNNFDLMLKETFLVEITLQDHFDKIIAPRYKNLLTFDEYETFAKIDPTTKNGQRGKYVEWLIKMAVDGHDSVSMLDKNPEGLTNFLTRFDKNPQGNSITQFKTIKDFVLFADKLPEKSNKELKREEKSVLNSPDEIEVIDPNVEFEGSRWLIARAITQSGDIKLARYKTSESAKWCTADPNYDGHWNSYTRSGDLIVFINLDDPKEKYQIFVKNDKIEESRDFDDRVDNTPRQIIKASKLFDEVYGQVADREPFKYIFDEEDAAGYLLSDNFEREWDCLNRIPDDDEMNDYYEEASQNEEFQINHWDRFLKACFEVYEIESDGKYWDGSNRMEYVSGYFKTPITGNEDDHEEASKAVYEWYEDLESRFDEYLEDESDKPDEAGHTTEEYKVLWNAWRDEVLYQFKSDYQKQLEFTEYFIEDFPYDFKYGSEIEYFERDNSDEQLKLNFESILKAMRGI